METSYDSVGSTGAMLGSMRGMLERNVSTLGVRLESVFAYDSGPIVSSGRKRILRGRYLQKDDEDVDACALVFGENETVSFGSECVNLGVCSQIGVGPRLLGIMVARVGDDPTPHPIIIEEDAGVSLAQLLERDEGCSTRTILHPVGTPERDRENKKIAFDVFSQILNAHRENLYHCDLRCENVCVRRFGDRPEDIRATVVDIELGANIDAGRPAARASLYDTLFRAIPTRLVGGTLGTNTEAVIVPNPLEMDLGYLAALLFHIARGDMALNNMHLASEDADEFLAFLENDVPFFGYDAKTMMLSIRRLDAEVDLRPIALRLGLREVCAQNFPTEELLHEARRYHRLYLDAEDMRSFKNSAVAKMHRLVDELVRMEFERYKEMRRSQGQPIEYETLEDQPADLQSSNYDQMAHVLVKVAALGYKTKGLGDCGSDERVVELSGEQVEVLARMEHARWVRERLSKGWTLGERSHEEKTSPYLVPYDDLSNDIQEYDRDVARNVIPLLQRAGIAVVKPA